MKQDSAGPLNVVPLHPREVQSLFSTAPFQWWIAGGWALDLFAGEEARPHFDTDVAIARHDQIIAREYLREWDFQYAVPGTRDPVIFEPWEAAGRLLTLRSTAVGPERIPARLGDSSFCFMRSSRKFGPSVTVCRCNIGWRASEAPRLTAYRICGRRLLYFTRLRGAGS